MKKLFAFVFFLTMALPSFAQEYIFTLGYNMMLPVSGTDMGEFIDEVSYKGISFSSRKFISQNSSLGFEVAWHVFDKKEYGTFTKDNVTATGTQIRYINSTPILVTYHLYFGNRRKMRFYICAGTGTYYTQQRTDLGLKSYTDDEWLFGVAPEAGIMVPLSRYNLLNISAKYNYAFPAGNSKGLQYWGLNLGLSFRQ
jgi:outer membrane protein W